MVSVDILPMELKKLGLKEKEANVYFVSLNLGYASAQKIAKMAKISRPTAYRILQILEKKELVNKVIDKNKTYFNAISPDKLLAILRIKKREIREQEREFLRIIAALRNKYYLTNKEEIKIYKGKQGIKILINDLLSTQSKNILTLTSLNERKKIKYLENIYYKIEKQIKNVNIKEIYGKNVEQELKTNSHYNKIINTLNIKRKFLKNLPKEFQGTLIIYDKVIFLSDESPIAISSEHKLLNKLIKLLFTTIWEMA